MVLYRAYASSLLVLSGSLSGDSPIASSSAEGGGECGGSRASRVDKIRIDFLVPGGYACGGGMTIVVVVLMVLYCGPLQKSGCLHVVRGQNAIF